MANYLAALVVKSGILKSDLDYQFIRGAMVIVFLFFGYQKWFAYEAQVLIPFISNGPLISWMYPVFGVRGASSFLGSAEWLICLLLFLGFWSRQLGVLGAFGSCATFVATVTIIPFMPDGWDTAAGGFPAMTNNVPFLVKDLVLLAASYYLLRQDVVRSMQSARPNRLFKTLAYILTRLHLLRGDVEYNLLRASMVMTFAWFGYTKWHQYGAQLMIPFISNSPFIWWLYPAFGLRGGARFLGASEWTIFVLLFAGFWDKRLGVLGAFGSAIVFFTTFTIIPFVPNGWDPAAGFPAMAGDVPFLMKDIVFLAVSIYLVKQDLIRLVLPNTNAGIAPRSRTSDAVRTA
jgi:uncharacterized membrane protein YkgB